jgi:sec-independent protein translocase protein TatB
MFDIGWSEMAVVALLALIVIGPRDLPRVMRTVGQWVRKARRVASDFQSSLDDMVRESELDEARKTIESSKNLDVGREFEKTVDPTGSVTEEARNLESDARRESDDSDVGSTRREVLGGSDEDGKGKSGGDAEGEETGTSEVQHTPHRTAPAHSVRPPQEDEGEDDAGRDPSQRSEEPVTGGADGSQRSA